MGNYYVMVGKGKYPIQPILKGPDFRGNWRDGSPIDKVVPQPLVYTLDSRARGNPKSMYYEQSIPVMRDDLIAALSAAGVDNVQYFNAMLLDKGSGTSYSNYKAYNIVGTIACADMGKSLVMDMSDEPLIDVVFDRLVLDESKARGALMFRLAESVGTIVVHASVKSSVEQAGIEGIVFYEPEEWSG